MNTEKRHCRVGDGVDQMVNYLIMFWRQAEIFATERTDDKARFNAEHFHQSVRHQARTTNQRRAFIFLTLTGMDNHARSVLFQRADLGVVNNLTAFGLENIRHRGGDFTVADDPARRNKNAAQTGDIRFTLAKLLRIQPFALQTVSGGAIP